MTILCKLKRRYKYCGKKYLLIIWEISTDILFQNNMDILWNVSQSISVTLTQFAMDHYFLFVFCIDVIYTGHQSTLCPVFFTITVNKTIFCSNIYGKKKNNARNGKKLIFVIFSVEYFEEIWWFSSPIHGLLGLQACNPDYYSYYRVLGVTDA